MQSFAIGLVHAEMEHSSSSSMMALAAVIDVNDILWGTGLISDDAWNQKKGWVATLTTEEVVSSLWQNIGQPVLTTLVQGATGVAERGAAAATQERGIEAAAATQIRDLASVAAAKSTRADRALEGPK